MADYSWSQEEVKFSSNPLCYSGRSSSACAELWWPNSAQQGKQKDGKDGRRKEEGSGGRSWLGQSWKSLPSVSSIQNNAGDQVQFSHCVLGHNELKWKGLGQESIRKWNMGWKWKKKVQEAASKSQRKYVNPRVHAFHRVCQYTSWKNEYINHDDHILIEMFTYS